MYSGTFLCQYICVSLCIEQYYTSREISNLAPGLFFCGYITTDWIGSDHADGNATCDPANGKTQIPIANPDRP